MTVGDKIPTLNRVRELYLVLKGATGYRIGHGCSVIGRRDAVNKRELEDSVYYLRTRLVQI